MSPDQQKVDALRAQLVEAAGRDDESVDVAVTQIIESVEFYCATRPKTKISETRKQLREAEKTLTAFLDAWDRLGIDARVLLGQTLPPALDGVAPRSLGYFQVRRLNELLPIVQKATQTAEALPDKKSNHDRVALACEVARVFRDVLHVKPATTRHDKATAKGGAQFSKAIGHAIDLAGEKGAGWESLIRNGLKLLDHPSSPYHK